MVTGGSGGVVFPPENLVFLHLPAKRERDGGGGGGRDGGRERDMSGNDLGKFSVQFHTMKKVN